jgi:hypothetical protein
MNNALEAIAASQHGLVARSQALRAGLSAGQWGAIAKSDDWRLVYAGVYRRVGAPRTWNQTLLAGCLAADGVASHRAAGVLWELPQVDRRLEITIPQRRRIELRDFEVHRTRCLQAVDRTQRSGIPVTSLALTVIDVSLQVPRLAPVIVNHVLATHKVQRRLEQIALDGYRAGLLPEPFFEYPVQLADGHWRYPDVAYPPPVSVGFEAHSYRHHSSLEALVDTAP